MFRSTTWANESESQSEGKKVIVAKPTTHSSGTKVETVTACEGLLVPEYQAPSSSATPLSARPEKNPTTQQEHTCYTCPGNPAHEVTKKGDQYVCECPNGNVKLGPDGKETGECVVNNLGTVGIELNPDCLLSGDCSLKVYETLEIRQSNQNPNSTLFAQDIILGLTSFIGTVVTIALIYSARQYIMSGADVGSADNAKKGMKNAMIGLVLVAASYFIIRLVQYIAAG